MAPTARDLARAGAVAALTSGLPSTAWALLTGGDPLAAARAAGTLLPGRLGRRSLVRGVLVHLAVSGLWTAVLGAAARRVRPGPAVGAAAGLGIAALDLGVLARRQPALRSLPQGPQWADHAAFGAVLGFLLGRGPGPDPAARVTRRRRRGSPGRSRRTRL